MRESLVENNRYTGRTVKVTLAENTIQQELPIAKIEVESPFFTGRTKAVVMKQPVHELLIGKRAKTQACSASAVPVYRVPVTKTAAVFTRRQEARSKVKTPPSKITQPSRLGNISPEELKTKQRSDQTLAQCRNLAESGEKRKDREEGSFHWKRGILYRGYVRPSGTQVVVSIIFETPEIVFRTELKNG